METSTVTKIDADAINAWVEKHLLPLCPEDAHVTIMPRSYHCTGESAFFAAVDIDNSLSLHELLALEVKEHTRAQYHHFYVDDVIAAAVGAGALQGNHFHVHYRW